MHVIRAIGVSLLIVLLSASACFAQNSKLEKAKEEVKTGETKTEEPAPSPRERNSTQSSTDDEHESHAGFFRTIGMVFVFTYYVAVGPHEAEAHKSNYLSRYPYENDLCGNYIEPSLIDPDRRKGRIDIANHVLLGKDVDGNHLKIRLRPSQSFYLQADYVLLLEERLLEPGYDQLGIYNLNFCFDRLRFQNFNLGWMLGANIIGSGVNKSGFTYGLNMEYFTPWRVSLYGSARGSKVNGSQLNQFELYARFSENRFTLDVGYEVVRIGSQNLQFLGAGLGVYL